MDADKKSSYLVAVVIGCYRIIASNQVVWIDPRSSAFICGSKPLFMLFATTSAGGGQDALAFGDAEGRFAVLAFDNLAADFIRD